MDIKLIQDKDLSKEELQLFLDKITTHINKKTGKNKFLLTPFFKLFNYKIVEYYPYLDNATSREKDWFTHFSYIGNFFEESDYCYFKIKLLKTSYISSVDKKTFERKLKLKSKTKSLNEIPVLTNGIEYYLYIFTGDKYELYWQFDLSEILYSNNDELFNKLVNTISYGVKYSFEYNDTEYSEYFLKRKDYVDTLERLRIEEKQKKHNIILNRLKDIPLNNKDKEYLINLFEEYEVDLLENIDKKINNYLTKRKGLCFRNLFNEIIESIDGYLFNENVDILKYHMLSKYIDKIYLKNKTFIDLGFYLLEEDKKHYKKEKAKYSPIQRKKLISDIEKLENDILEDMMYWEQFIKNMTEVTGGNYNDFKL